MDRVGTGDLGGGTQVVVGLNAEVTTEGETSKESDGDLVGGEGETSI